jgi:hypothetical protein
MAGPRRLAEECAPRAGAREMNRESAAELCPAGSGISFERTGPAFHGETGMQQGRGGMGSRKHGVSGHPAQSPRLRLAMKLAAERGEYDGRARRRRRLLPFASVREAFNTRPGGRR